MRTLAFAARRRRIDFAKIAAVSAMLVGSWIIAFAAGRALFALVGLIG